MIKCVIIGGGTFSKVACHLALATPAFGNTAKILKGKMDNIASGVVDTVLTLTKMADSSSTIVTNEDVSDYVDCLLADSSVKAIIMNAALCDFSMKNPSELTRLSSQQNYTTELRGVSSKVISKIKATRPDVTVVGFKTTCNDTKIQQCTKALDLIAQSNLDFVLANDVGNYSNILITNSLSIHKGSRNDLLDVLCQMVADKIKEGECFRYA